MWRRLIVIVWRPLEHILTPSSKTTEKFFRGNMSGSTWVTLPFGDIAMAQWLMTRPAETRVCMYPTDRSTDQRFLCAHITQKRVDCWPISVIQTLPKSSWDALGPCFIKQKFTDDGRGWRPLEILSRLFLCAHITQKHFDRFCSFKNSWKAFWTE